MAKERKGDTLYFALNKAIKENIGKQQFKHYNTGDIYQIYGLEPSVSKDEWYIYAYNTTKKKNEHLNLKELRLLEEIVK